MGASLLSEHPNDEALLAYLDGELSKARTRSIRNHLKSCWKCRFVLADLESQAQTISRLLSAKLDSDPDRFVNAKEKFSRWRASFEKRQKSFFRKTTILVARRRRAARCSCPIGLADRMVQDVASIRRSQTNLKRHVAHFPSYRGRR